MFPGSNLTIDDMQDAMTENGFAPASIDAQVIPCRENSAYGYSGILTASGRKALPRKKVPEHAFRHNSRD